MISISDLYNIYLKHPKIITDSRKIEEGCIFFALKGPNFNGNKYAEAALQKGAAYAVIDEPEFGSNEQCILVSDSLTTLQQLATFHRQHFKIPLLAITGSNGKTTTKELVNATLSCHYKVHCTNGNFNNHIGVPLTLLDMPLDTEIAIIEMGANHVGEIDFLCDIALPTHGLITNIGKAHLEGFGGIEGVKKGKSELYKYLGRTGGMIFVNSDEEYLFDLSRKNKNKLFYRDNKNPTNETEVGILKSEPQVEATFLDLSKNEILKVNSHLMGVYNFKNIMTAIVIALHFKIPAVKIKLAVEAYQPDNNRSQLKRKGTNVYLMDAYNANPDSMRNALNYFSTIDASKKIVVIGDMLELGEYSESEHNQMVDLAIRLNFSGIWLVGEAFAKTKQKADHLRRFKNVDELKVWYDSNSESDAHFLLKGSRGIQLESLLD
ncbi:MAG: UDP-N-acetylmuramoyl-tripeptide--D-alanyl-D-alanine ligase [Saprospiraceae bacterium]